MSKLAASCEDVSEIAEEFGSGAEIEVEPVAGIAEEFEPVAEIEVEPVAEIAEEFESGEKVWSAYYHAPAIIEKEIVPDEKYESKAYSIYVLEKSEDPESYFFKAGISGFYAYALACELGKLKHLEQYGVDLRQL